MVGDYDFMRHNLRRLLLLIFAVSLLVGSASPEFLNAKEPPQHRNHALSSSVLQSDLDDKSAVATQEIRYIAPQVEEVYLVWGINGWQPAPESLRPAGTDLRPAGPQKVPIMHTRMAREADSFVSRISVPRGTLIDYGFLITEPQSLLPNHIPFWDGRDGFSRRVEDTGRIEIHSALDFSRWRMLKNDVFYVVNHDLPSPPLALLLTLVAGVGWLYFCVPQDIDARVSRTILAAVTSLGLLFRLWTAMTTGRLFSIPPTFIGDEKGYNVLAEGLLNGIFFQIPETTPVYPLFLAACYALFNHSYLLTLCTQALVATATILLTY